MSSLITSNELIINQKRLPSLDSQEYDAFWKNERDKCINGLLIDGVYLSGFLYWHLNYFKCDIDFTDDMGNNIMIYGSPYLRDNEWLVDDYIQQGEKAKKGVLLAGTRRFAKTIIEQSYICRKATFFRNTQNVVSGTNQKDIDLIIGGVRKCFRNMVPAFKHGILQNSAKEQISLGIKLNSNESDVFSTIPVRNLDEGKNTEALAGLTPFSVVLDEAGKASWLDCYSALIPALGTPTGWRCSPLVFATSGDMNKAQDLKEAFENPDTYNFLAVEVPDEKLIHKRGVFIPGHYAHDFRKDEKKLTDFLNLDKEEHPNLAKIDIKVTNFERANTQIDDERKRASKSDKPNALLKLTMYHPRNTQELFLTDSGNNFPIDLCRAQLAKIEQTPVGQAVSLYIDIDGKVKHRVSEKKLVTDLPVKNNSYKEGVIWIYEFPKHDAPFTLYVAGNDPYKTAVSAQSDSLGATYIYKRIHTIAGEDFQDTIVAQYVGRPNDMDVWLENTRLLLKFYRAYCLCENNDEVFIRYMIGLNEAPIYLAPTPQFLRDLTPTSKVRKDYGIHATEKLINLLHTDINQYLREVINTEKDEEGFPIRQVFGVSKINDPMLLRELINFNSDGNFDRIRAFGLALSFAKSLTSQGPVQDNKRDKFASYKNIKKSTSIFNKNIRLWR